MIHREVYVKQPSAGAVSWNSYGDFRGLMQQLVINPSISSTIYDFSLTNDLGDVVYSKKGNRGTFIDDSKVALHGIYTMAIANATVSTNSYTASLIWDDDYK